MGIHQAGAQAVTYRGRVQGGVIVFEGPARPPEGAIVRVEEIPEQRPVGEGLDRLAGQAQDLPDDLAERHDEYRRQRP